MQKYLYVHADPVSFIDSTGQFTLGELLAASAAILLLSAALVTLAFPSTPWPGWQSSNSWGAGGTPWGTAMGREWYEDGSIGYSYSSPSDDDATMDDVLTEFFNSVGPTTRHFGQKSFMTSVMRDADSIVAIRDRLVAQMRQGAVAAGRLDCSEARQHFSWDATRLVWLRITRGAGGNMGAIGRYGAYVDIVPGPLPNGGTGYILRFHAINDTTRESGGGNGPANRPIHEEWDWEEWYDPSGNKVGPEIEPDWDPAPF